MAGSARTSARVQALGMLNSAAFARATSMLRSAHVTTCRCGDCCADQRYCPEIRPQPTTAIRVGSMPRMIQVQSPEESGRIFLRIRKTNRHFTGGSYDEESKLCIDAAASNRGNAGSGAGRPDLPAKCAC